VEKEDKQKEEEDQDEGSSQDSTKDDGDNEDSDEEGEVAQDYHEDYDSFPFGSRLPSVILPEFNEVETEELEEREQLFEEETDGENDGKKEILSTEPSYREVELEASTSKPRYVIRKLSRKRVPKTLIKERRERALEGSQEYQPVHTGGEVKLVMRQGQGYVPEHSLSHMAQTQ